MARRLALVLLLMLVSSQAFATSRVWISEFASIGNVVPSGQAQIAVLPSITNQPVLDFTSGVQTSAAFNAGTRFIRVVCEVQCAIKGSGTATNADTLLPAYLPEYFGVSGGATISIIAAP